MFVKYSPKVPHLKVIPLIPVKGKESSFDNDTVTLRSGTNELTEKEWEAIQPHIKDLIEKKEIVPFSVPVKDGAGGGKPKQAKTLKDVPVGTARIIIQSCQDPKTLKKWFNQELPDEILLVLSKRMRKLKVEPDDIEEEDAGLDLNSDDITTEDDTVTTPVNKTDTTGDADTEEDDAGEEEDGDDDEDDIPDFDGSKDKDK